MIKYSKETNTINKLMNTASAPLSPQQLFATLQRGEAPVLLDVRTPLEFGEVHIEGARLVPLDELEPAAVARDHGAAGACVLICRSGNRAKKAAEKLAAAGMTNLHILDGGMLAWSEAGLPASRGRKVMSLERQVRIAAGAIVLTGVVLAQFVSPAFIWLAGFVGAGLMFAGITDWCGMGLLIAKAPWNRTPGAGGNAAAVGTGASCCS